MKRPFHSMDYTLLTKEVSISEGNGVWVVDLAKIQTKPGKKYTIRVMNFFGELHTIDVTLEGGTKSEAAKSTKTRAKTVAPVDKKNASMTDDNGKPISLEKYIAK